MYIWLVKIKMYILILWRLALTIKSQNIRKLFLISKNLFINKYAFRKKITTMALTPDSNYLICGDVQGLLYIWNLTKE